MHLFNGKPCYLCHQAAIHNEEDDAAPQDCTYALDLGNAQSVSPSIHPSQLPKT
jgi:hypothetical protein